jgi:hypothetical protein
VVRVVDSKLVAARVVEANPVEANLVERAAAVVAVATADRPK